MEYKQSNKKKKSLWLIIQSRFVCTLHWPAGRREVGVRWRKSRMGGVGRESWERWKIVNHATGMILTRAFFSEWDSYKT